MSGRNSIRCWGLPYLGDFFLFLCNAKHAIWVFHQGICGCQKLDVFFIVIKIRRRESWANNRLKKVSRSSNIIQCHLMALTSLVASDDLVRPSVSGHDLEFYHFLTTMNEICAMVDFITSQGLSCRKFCLSARSGWPDFLSQRLTWGNTIVHPFLHIPASSTFIAKLYLRRHTRKISYTSHSF